MIFYDISLNGSMMTRFIPNLHKEEKKGEEKEGEGGEGDSIWKLLGFFFFKPFLSSQVCV